MEPSNEQRRALARINSLNGELIIGVDEVGYGCIAGPVAVGAVVASSSWRDNRVRDSKKLDHPQRARLVREVLHPPVVAFSIVLNHTSEIVDQLGVVGARDDLVAQVVKACRKLYPKALVVMDGNQLPPGVEGIVCLPKADDLVKAVSAASILAKEDRDACMKLIHEEWPQYGFKAHVGYGTTQHIQALNKYGPCPIHRFSYKNVQEIARRFGYEPVDSSKPSPSGAAVGKLSKWRQPSNGMRVSTSSSRR